VAAYLRARRAGSPVAFWMIAALGVGLAGAAWRVDAGDIWQRFGSAAGAAVSRVAIWRATLPIVRDFWLTGAKLQGDGGEYRIRYIVDDDEPRFIDKWEPIWLSGWINGKHTVRLELLDKDGRPVDNGGYNTTSREITVAK